MEDKRRGKAQSPQHWSGSGRQEIEMFDRESRPHGMAKFTQLDYHFTSQHLAEDPVEKHVLVLIGRCLQSRELTAPSRSKERTGGTSVGNSQKSCKPFPLSTVSEDGAFAGVIDDVSATMDITNRTDVLRIIDKGKKLGVIPMHVAYDHSAIMSLSLHNIKIMKHNSTEDLLLRIPMHEIAAICYIKDDKQHILAIKFGTPEVCQLAVLYCDSKPVAEELCALVGQCFRLIYTEAMIEILNSSIDPTGIPSTGGSTTIPNNEARSVNGSDIPLPPRVPSDGGSTTSLSAEELLKDYMKKLHKELDASELKIFAQALQDMDGRFQDFCERVLQLYGAERKHLLAEMLPFIPAENLPNFEDFLAHNGILLPESTSTLSSYRSNIRNYPTRRSIGEVSTTSSISNNPTSDEALHHLLELTESQYDSVVVDTDPNKYVPSADY